MPCCRVCFLLDSRCFWRIDCSAEILWSSVASASVKEFPDFFSCLCLLFSDWKIESLVTVHIVNEMIHSSDELLYHSFYRSKEKFYFNFLLPTYLAQFSQFLHFRFVVPQLLSQDIVLMIQPLFINDLSLFVLFGYDILRWQGWSR